MQRRSGQPGVPRRRLHSALGIATVALHAESGRGRGWASAQGLAPATDGVGVLAEALAPEAFERRREVAAGATPAHNYLRSRHEANDTDSTRSRSVDVP